MTPYRVDVSLLFCRGIGKIGRNVCREGYVVPIVSARTCPRLAVSTPIVVVLLHREPLWPVSYLPRHASRGMAQARIQVNSILQHARALTRQYLSSMLACSSKGGQYMCRRTR
jgi:hypothetical protein